MTAETLQVDPAATTESMVLELTTTKSVLVRDVSVEDMHGDIEHQKIKVEGCPSALG